jgi:hypothetical protein
MTIDYYFESSQLATAWSSISQRFQQSESAILEYERQMSAQSFYNSDHRLQATLPLSIVMNDAFFQSSILSQQRQFPRQHTRDDRVHVLVTHLVEDQPSA